ncbi:PLU-1-domain-containing protein [Polychaeton citri CBS 116435]|uniref:PLU-1-domain-containing protein n=1 Tax=Polychaeton citri CBS 116435 TaxID=1314669 RepID=A0A9P4UTW2_9PEZI|nr:PLU-1-domain-containing protein [Polychaeton citri CBS 116435]
MASSTIVRIPTLTANPQQGGPSSAIDHELLKSRVAASLTAPGTLNGPPSGNNHSIPLSARRAVALDLDTVERRGGLKPIPTDETKDGKRLFEIPDAPTYRPTAEEFKDPMEYIRKIAPEGSKYGICKVIPPEGWDPPLAINTERFHFRTRRQELNSVEGGNRVNNDYLDQLARFHKQHGHNLNRFPCVDKRPLDLYRLKKTVEKKGGFDAVCKGKRWAEVGRDLGYSGKIMSSLSTSLKNSYQKWLLPYEEYLRLAKPGVHQQLELLNGGPITPSPGQSPAKKSQASTPLGLAAGAPADGTPTMRAHAALNASLTSNSNQNGNSSHPGPQHSAASVPVQSQRPTPPVTGGFTPVNVGGGFTAVNAQPQQATPTSNGGFAPINGINGAAHAQSAPPAPPPHGHANRPDANGNSQPDATSSLKRQRSDMSLSPNDVDALNRRSKRLRRDVPTVAGSNMHHSRMGMASGVNNKLKPQRDRDDLRAGEQCENCGRADEAPKMLYCATCDCAYHTYCLDPPIKQRPSHEWNCPRCLVGTGEYGFEEGDVYSLAGFQKKANEFKHAHFANLPGAYSPFRDGKKTIEEADVEREFWRLVEDLTDTVEVEYGADIHSTTHGSGFPTIERQPRDPYSTDAWNLNIMPLDKESLFRHIKQDISGMTVPWLYVGMVFSTFCWHNEDHFTYSANYQHFGETKTWYGIPGDDSYKFEAAMKEEVPELFETQPDLLFQLVTLAKPEKLRKAGVRVYATDQHAGQFVLTFPRAYHAGFNHGFNLNEAVNFAPVDWEPYGEEGVKRLRDYRKQPCFSHDELLLTCAGRDGSSIRTAKWLAPALERMRDDELAARKYFVPTEEKGSDQSGIALDDGYTGPRYSAEPVIMETENGDPEEEVICSFCKAFCFLSKFVCTKTNRTLCLLHAGGYECCDALESERYSGRDGLHLLYHRMADDQLIKTVSKVVERAAIPQSWAAKVNAELEETARPDLKRLRTLLSEGEKIQYELPQLADLRKFVERCNEWVDDANQFITRKQQNRRKNEKAWRKSMPKAPEVEEKEKELRNVANIHRLLERADMISFDCQEIATLRERAEAIAEFQQEANKALVEITARSTADFEDLIERGKDFHVDMKEIETLENLVKRLKWNDDASVMRPDSEAMRQTHTLAEIEKLIQRGVEINVPDANPDLLFFREHLAQGELWEQKAKELMSVEQVHYQQLDALSRQAETLPVSPETRARVDAILKKQREVQEQIKSLYERSMDFDFRKRPMYKEVKDVMNDLEELQSKPSGTIDLERQQRKHEDWMRRGKKLFGKANAPLHILHQHMKGVENRNVHCFDMRDTPRMPVEPSSRHATPEPASDPAEERGEDEEGGGTHGSSSSRDVFCICRRPESGMMIECEQCREWYHGKCLKIARGKVKEDDKYTCPICDWRVKIPRDAARPKLEDLQGWQEDLETLPFQPEEEETLASIIYTAQVFRDFMRPLVNPLMSSPDEVPTLRFHLRKIEGADILLAYETNYLRQELHKLYPVAPEAPPLIEASMSTRKPRPTKQQKLMAQLGITNPEDLPQELKMKPHIAKRKASEAMAKNQPPLQPASAGVGSPSSVNFPTPGPSGLPGSNEGQAGGSQAKSHLTPLAIQVLGDLAGAPVVNQMLQSEPHMMRDKLERVKTVLQQDRSIHNDLIAVQNRVNELKNSRSWSPAYGYNSNAFGNSSTSSYRDQPLFTTAAQDRSHMPTLGSPAQLSPPVYASNEASPNFDTNMFNTSVNDDSFFNGSDNGSSKLANINPSPDFGKSGVGIFDSPKGAGILTHAGVNSPGFDGSQQSVGGNIDNIFADIVHDHDVLASSDGVMDSKGADDGDLVHPDATAMDLDATAMKQADEGPR